MDRKPSLELLNKKLTPDEHCESRSLSDRSIAAVDSSSTASPSSTSTSAENVGVIAMPDKVPCLVICLAVSACLPRWLPRSLSLGSVDDCGLRTEPGQRLAHILGCIPWLLCPRQLISYKCLQWVNGRGVGGKMFRASGCRRVTTGCM